MSTSRIATIINCSIQTIYNILKLFSETNDVLERTGRGGGNSLSIDERHVLRQLFYRYPNETSNRVNDRFYRRTGHTINSRTIRNYRRSLGFHPVHYRTQPLLNQNHARERLLFSYGHIDEDWSQIIFSDEKAFEVDCTGIVYWTPYNRPRPTEFVNPVKFRIAVFGAIWYNSKSDLIFIRDRTNTTTFVEYLRSAFRSHRRYIKNFSFIHDHAKWAHTSLSHVKASYALDGRFERGFQSLQTYFVAIEQRWYNTGSMNTPRSLHTASILNNGKILVAGGTAGDEYDFLNSAELYDSSTQMWTTTGNMSIPRTCHTACLLSNGKVLVIGGNTIDNLYFSKVKMLKNVNKNNSSKNHKVSVLSNKARLIDNYNSSCELYDPSTGVWSTTGSMNEGRTYHTAVVLADGKVLVAGGYNQGHLSTAELYDSLTEIWTTTGSMNDARESHTASVLPDGKVLVSGGTNSDTLNSAELYDPSKETWITTGDMNYRREYHVASVLTDGRVFVTGGGDDITPLYTAEIYDPSTGTWEATNSMNIARGLYSASVLINGKVLIAGGSNSTAAINSAELYDPSTGIWTLIDSMGNPRIYHTASRLTDGKILITGGSLDGESSLKSAELYISSSENLTTVDRMENKENNIKSSA